MLHNGTKVFGSCVAQNFPTLGCTEIPDGLFIGTAYVLLHRNARRFIVTKNTHELLHVEAYEGVPEAMVSGSYRSFDTAENQPLQRAQKLYQI